LAYCFACHSRIARDASTSDARPGADAEPEDGSSSDADAGLHLFDAIAFMDAEAPDGRMAGLDGEPLPDLGVPKPGEVCTLPLTWDTSATRFVLGTTTTAPHRDRLTCAGTGAGSTAPESWWSIDLSVASHLVLRLGTAGWDGVIAARTGTCADTQEICGNAPAIAEVPSARGNVFVGIEGYSSGGGPYIARAEITPPLIVPAPNGMCGGAQMLTLPQSSVGHDFGGTDLMLPQCVIAGAVYYAFDLAAPSSVSIRVEPLAGADVDMAVVDGACASVNACAQTPGRGIAERIGPLSLAAGTHVIAVGTQVALPSYGSFRVSARAGPACLSDVDCALGLQCSPNLACGPPSGTIVTSTRAYAIPDGQGALDVPIRMTGPSPRPSAVRFRLELQHPSPQDLVALLISPGGPRAITVRLRDRSEGALAAVYGSDRPPDGPGSFDDFGLLTTAQGTWTLHIEDRVLGDQGLVLRYALEVE
jgi:hypothetical protein